MKGVTSHLTSTLWDRLLSLRAGEGSAERRGAGPPFFNCWPEGDFGTVHTGAASERGQVVRGARQLPQSKGRGPTSCEGDDPHRIYFRHSGLELRTGRVTDRRVAANFYNRSLFEHHGVLTQLK